MSDVMTRMTEETSSSQFKRKEQRNSKADSSSPLSFHVVRSEFVKYDGGS